MRSVRLRVPGRVERARRQALPHDVGDDARADHGRAIASALAGSFRPVRIEAVAECSARVMGEEAVLALPADAVPGAERVDVDVPSVRVEGNAVPRRGESEDRLAGVRQSAGEVVEAAVGPAGRQFEHRQPARPPERNETSAWAFASTCRRTRRVSPDQLGAERGGREEHGRGEAGEGRGSESCSPAWHRHLRWLAVAYAAQPVIAPAARSATTPGWG